MDSEPPAIHVQESDMNSVLFLFDVDGTMTDTKDIDDQCFTEVLSELYGFDIHNMDWSEFNHVTDTGLCDEIYMRHKGRKISKTELKRVQKLFVKKINSSIKNEPKRFNSIPGVQEFLNHATRQNIPMAIATGGWRKSAELKLNAANIPYEPFTLATSNDSFKRRTIMNVAIARAQFEYQRKFSSIIYFGDGLWDAKTCAAMDIPLIGIDFHKTGKLDGSHASHVFSDFKDIKGIYDAVYQIQAKYGK